MSVDLREFKTSGIGILAFLDRGEIKGWHFIPAKFISVIHENRIAVKLEWWNGDGTAFHPAGAIFIWKDVLPVGPRFGPVDLMIQSTPQTLGAFLWPVDDFYYHEELVAEKMLSGSMHVVIDREIKIEQDQMYVPATDQLWEVVRYVHFDNENDAIVATALLDQPLTMQEFLELTEKHAKATPYGHSHCSRNRRRDLISNALTLYGGLQKGQLNVIASGVNCGKSMMAAEMAYQMIKFNKNSIYGKKADVIYIDTEATPSMTMKRFQHSRQHRITSVQLRDKSVRRSRR